jgi:hypothetical protein
MPPSVDSDSDDAAPTTDRTRAGKRPRSQYDGEHCLTKQDLEDSQAETAKLIMRSIGGAMQKLIDRAVDNIRVTS